jgi:hypothetical protein
MWLLFVGEFLGCCGVDATSRGRSCRFSSISVFFYDDRGFPLANAEWDLHDGCFLSEDLARWSLDVQHSVIS